MKVCARRAVSTATQCIAAAQSSHPHNNSGATREALSSDTREMTEQIPPLVEAIKANTECPDSTSSQSELMYVAEVFLHVSSTAHTICSFSKTL